MSPYIRNPISHWSPRTLRSWIFRCHLLPVCCTFPSVPPRSFTVGGNLQCLRRGADRGADCGGEGITGGVWIKGGVLSKGEFIRFVIAFDMLLLQQWGGQNSVGYYIPQTFTSIGYTNSILAFRHLPRRQSRRRRFVDMLFFVICHSQDAPACPGEARPGNQPPVREQGDGHDVAHLYVLLPDGVGTAAVGLSLGYLPHAYEALRSPFGFGYPDNPQMMRNLGYQLFPILGTINILQGGRWGMSAGWVLQLQSSGLPIVDALGLALILCSSIMLSTVQLTAPIRASAHVPPVLPGEIEAAQADDVSLAHSGATCVFVFVPALCNSPSLY
ncbi:hypothetical protein H0H81_001821 [Sphagnurus paluster]|uniref:Uncharacterized protein n=1 Tax=Sphagnurus paluster TaxID=117069 RepID=A0A9P7GRC1_9AGAR|nr:hypothetical protein H0H81_001821 [Sphagnurus paluster]